MVPWRRKSSFEVTPSPALCLMDRLRLDRLEVLLCVDKGDTASYASLHFDHPNQTDQDLAGWGSPGWEDQAEGVYPSKQNGCCQSGWGSVILGVLIIINAFLLGVVYFSIRTLTTSLEHVDTVPTYATALLLCCCGVLLVFIYKRQEPIVLLPTLVLCVVCLVLCLISTILTVYRVILTMLSFNQCSFIADLRQCHCLLTSHHPSTSRADQTERDVVYSDTASCRSIQHNLFQFVCVQGALYCSALVLCACGLALVAYMLSKEKTSGENRSPRVPEVDVRSISSSLRDLYASNFDLRPHSHVPRQVALPGVGDTIPRVFSHSILRLGYGNEDAFRGEERGSGQQRTDHEMTTRPTGRHDHGEFGMSFDNLREGIQETSLENRENAPTQTNREQTVGASQDITGQRGRTDSIQENNSSRTNAVPPATNAETNNASTNTNQNTTAANANELRNQRRQRRRRRCVAAAGTSHSATCHCPACAQSPRPPPWYMFQPVPNEPPPPYRPHTLPPYMEDDSVPEYHSRAATPDTLCVRL